MMKTCIKFVPRTKEVDYISIVRGNAGCSSYVARVGGKQLVNLQPGCIYEFGEVQHEIMHALGFYHEQSRQDRDNFVEIIWDNIKTEQHDQFKKYVTNTLGLPYDYESIMHYGFNYFAIDITKPTILPKTKQPIGNRQIMSAMDVKRINTLYSCPSIKGSGFSISNIFSGQTSGSGSNAQPGSQSGSGAGVTQCPIRFSSAVIPTTTSSGLSGFLWGRLKDAAKKKAEDVVCGVVG